MRFKTQLKTRQNRGFAIARVVAIIFVLATGLGGALQAQSYFPERPDDPRAVNFTKEAFGAHADGVGDDAEALQSAINRVQETTRMGVVLIPEGRYRLGKTVFVWQGIRLIGYGSKRPVFVLGRDTPGFQEGTAHYMIHFADNRPQPGGPFVDASEFTFYSGLNNIDFELQDGNPAAIAVRFRVAQHSLLTHIDFQVGSARAALEDIGNQASDIHVHGGQYGIITKRTSPAWQFLLMDSSFDGQRAAAIQTMEAGFTLVRVRFANTPVALKITSGEVEQLYGRDLQLENISEAAFVAGNWRNSHSAVTFTNIACRNVPRFYSGPQPVAAPSTHYLVQNFSLGLEIGPDGREQGIQLRHRERRLSNPRPATITDIPSLPPMDNWVNVRALGVKGEPSADDAAVLQAAIDQHPVLFFPSGVYRVSRPLMLKPETVLIGLNPGTTQITLISGSAAFAGEGDPIGVITAPSGGSNIINSLSIGAGTRNPRAAGVLWLAGPTSMLDDVSFPTGFGGGAPGRGSRDTQAGNLIVQDGGGGIFRGCWPHDTNGKAGLLVKNTSTPGTIYQMSVEHHLRIETQFHNVRDWQVFALQTEEENPAGALANAVDIRNSHDLLFANTYMYRVSRNVLPKTTAAIVSASDSIAFQNVKVFSQTRLAFDNAVFDESSGIAVRPHFFTRFIVNQGMKTPGPLRPPKAFARRATLERLATGFSNASGLTASDTGEVYFTDAANRKIYHWNAATKQPEVLAEIPGQPQVLGFVPPSSLLAIANERAVYHLNINQDATGDSPGSTKAEAVKEIDEILAESSLLLPVGLHNELAVMKDLVEHRGYLYRRGSNTAVINTVTNEHRGYFYAPGTQTAIMAGGTWRPYLQSSQLAPFTPGQSRYLTSEDDGRTYVAKLIDYNSLSTTVFAERGGTSVVADTEGNVYIASGQVWIYDGKGQEIGVLELPERPASLAFGGPDKRTLFIGARSSLYSIRTKAPGF
jgi:pectate lyase-like protein/SMP-30/gluconolaconase/LRE-like protein